MNKNFPTPEHKRVFIVVKTIPTESTSYEETVCTAGITNDGKWIRLYPIPFRKLPQSKRYHKYQWIEVDAFRNSKDFRPESYKCDYESIKLCEEIKDWNERRKICIDSMKVYDDFEELINLAKAKNSYLSLAVFKPTKMLDCFCTPRDTEAQLKKQKEIKASHIKDLFNPDEQDFLQAEPIPVFLKYKFLDSKGKERNLMVEDWEAYELYRKYKNNPEEAKQKLTDKYKEFMTNDYDTYFFVGTMKKYQLITTNPFSIIGVFYQKKNQQLCLAF